MPGTSASPRPIEIAENDAAQFTPNVVTLSEGETVAFTIRNVGLKEHSFSIGPEADVFATPTKARATGTVQSLGTATVQFQVTGAGPFVFASTSDGDVAAGQVGYAIVVGPDVPTVGNDAKPRFVALTATPTVFDVTALSVTRGETITFLVSNMGTDVREFIVGPFDQVVLAKIDQVTTVTTGPISPGQVKPVTYTFPQTGNFGYAMHVPGATTVQPPGTISFR